MLHRFVNKCLINSVLAYVSAALRSFNTFYVMILVVMYHSKQTQRKQRWYLYTVMMDKPGRQLYTATNVQRKNQDATLMHIRIFILVIEASPHQAMLRIIIE